MVKKTPKQKEVIKNLENFYNSREEVINSFWDYVKMLSARITMLNKMRLREKDLKY